MNLAGASRQSKATNIYADNALATDVRPRRFRRGFTSFRGHSKRLSKDRNEDVRALKAIYAAVGKIDERNITDDFQPSQVLYRLTEKATTGRIA